MTATKQAAHQHQHSNGAATAKARPAPIPACSSLHQLSLREYFDWSWVSAFSSSLLPVTRWDADHGRDLAIVLP